MAAASEEWTNKTFQTFQGEKNVKKVMSAHLCELGFIFHGSLNVSHNPDYKKQLLDMQ